jgi:hypothetical protein
MLSHRFWKNKGLPEEAAPTKKTALCKNSLSRQDNALSLLLLFRINRRTVPYFICCYFNHLITRM